MAWDFPFGTIRKKPPTLAPIPSLERSTKTGIYSQPRFPRTTEDLFLVTGELSSGQARHYPHPTPDAECCQAGVREADELFGPDPTYSFPQENSVFAPRLYIQLMPWSLHSHYFDKYLLSDYYVSGNVPGVGDNLLPLSLPSFLRIPSFLQ